MKLSNLKKWTEYPKNQKNECIRFQNTKHIVWIQCNNIISRYRFRLKQKKKPKQILEMKIQLSFFSFSSHSFWNEKTFDLEFNKADTIVYIGAV